MGAIPTYLPINGCEVPGFAAEEVRFVKSTVRLMENGEWKTTSEFQIERAEAALDRWEPPTPRIERDPLPSEEYA